ncbi:hypothetical protein IAR50_002592 [Cryptococcus sp. DSM 104548]
MHFFPKSHFLIQTLNSHCDTPALVDASPAPSGLTALKRELQLSHITADALLTAVQDLEAGQTKLKAELKVSRDEKEELKREIEALKEEPVGKTNKLKELKGELKGMKGKLRGVAGV